MKLRDSLPFLSLPLILLCTAASLAACSSDDETSDAGDDTHDAAAPPSDAHTAASDNDAGNLLMDAADSPPGDAAISNGGPRQALQDRLQAALAEAPAGVDGMTLLVHDARDERVIDMTVGDFGATRRVPVASASKLITGLVLLRAMQTTDLGFSSTPRDVLGWTDNEAADATLDHLGAFVSGLPPNHLCTARVGISLQACAEDLSQVSSTAAPGERYDYGPTHQATAGAMAEVATKQSWATLFEELKQAVGLDDPELRYVTYPKQRLGTMNPLLAGGLLATPNEYMPMLAIAFHEGRIGERTFIDANLIARMRRNPYTDAVIGISPADIRGFDFRYGWSAWLNCAGAVTSCNVISSPGAFGFTPWIDWDAGYYAVLAMESEEQGGPAFSVPLAEELRPLIEAVLDETR